MLKGYATRSWRFKQLLLLGILWSLPVCSNEPPSTRGARESTVVIEGDSRSKETTAGSSNEKPPPMLRREDAPQAQSAAALPRELLDEVRREYPDGFTEDSFRFDPDRVEAVAIDLNDDGTDEYFVWARNGFCGSAGCSFEIFRKSQAGFEAIYNEAQVFAEPGDVAGSVLETRTTGYRDLCFSRVYWNERYTKRLIFDGDAYRTNTVVGAPCP